MVSDSSVNRKSLQVLSQ